MRMRPASLTAAAPPSRCQVTHSVRLIEVKATISSAAPMRISLVDREALPRRKVCMGGKRTTVSGVR